MKTESQIRKILEQAESTYMDKDESSDIDMMPADAYMLASALQWVLDDPDAEESLNRSGYIWEGKVKVDE